MTGFEPYTKKARWTMFLEEKEQDTFCDSCRKRLTASPLLQGGWILQTQGAGWAIRIH